MGSGFKDFAAGDILTAADVDGYLMRQTVMTFADASARDSALSGVLDEGMVAYLEDTNELTAYDGSAWVIYAGRGYTYVQTVVFTSSGTFTKASYPWLRGVKVRVQGGGGAGGGHTGAGDQAKSGGGGGGYGEKFVLASALGASETVTIGAGGTGGTGAGGNGGNSSFAGVQGDGGVGGNFDPGGGGTFTGADWGARGSAGQAAGVQVTGPSGSGGASHLGGGGAGFGFAVFTSAGNAGTIYGGGGAGARVVGGATANGGAGAAGIVILELYA